MRMFLKEWQRLQSICRGPYVRSVDSRVAAWCELTGVRASEREGTYRHRSSCRGLDNAAAFAEPNAGVAELVAITTKDDLIAVFDEASFLSARHVKRFGRARCQFKQATKIFFIGTRNGA